jgi:hypothetical protein
VFVAARVTSTMNQDSTHFVVRVYVHMALRVFSLHFQKVFFANIDLWTNMLNYRNYTNVMTRAVTSLTRAESSGRVCFACRGTTHTHIHTHTHTHTQPPLLDITTFPCDTATITYSTTLDSVLCRPFKCYPCFIQNMISAKLNG